MFIFKLYLPILSWLTFQGVGDVSADERTPGFIYGSKLNKSTWHSCSFSQVIIIMQRWMRLQLSGARVCTLDFALAVLEQCNNALISNVLRSAQHCIALKCIEDADVEWLNVTRGLCKQRLLSSTNISDTPSFKINSLHISFTKSILFLGQG